MRLFLAKKERPINTTQVLILKALKGGKEVYGLDLIHKVREASSISYTPINWDYNPPFLTGNSIFFDLKSLREKGLISSIEKGPPLSYANGLRRQYYFLTDAGREVVQQIESLFALLENNT